MHRSLYAYLPASLNRHNCCGPKELLLPWLPAHIRDVIHPGQASRVAYVSLVYMLSPLPRHRDWRHCLAHSPSPISLPRNGGRVGLCIGIFETCSAFTHVTACTLAGSSKMTRHIRGSSHFVTSMTALIASGWSNIAGWDLHPLENAAFARRTPTPALPGYWSERQFIRVSGHSGADFTQSLQKVLL